MNSKQLAYTDVDTSAVTTRTIFEAPFFETILMVKKAAIEALAALKLADISECDCLVQAIRTVCETNCGLNRCTLLLSNRALNAAVDERILEAAGISDSSEQTQARRCLLKTLQTADDVVATAKSLMVARSLRQLEEAVQRMKVSLRRKACQFAQVPSVARRRLRDDATITLGDSFESYAAMFEAIEQEIRKVARAEVVSFVGTDVGLKECSTVRTVFSKQVCCELQQLVESVIRLPVNVLAGQAMDTALIIKHGVVQACAAVFWKLGRDLRLLCSGPRCGFGQITLPALAPGSSIMPGKINPVILEMAMSSADQVSANHSGLVMGSLTGWLEFGSESLVPIRAFVISCHVLSQTMTNVVERCIDGIEPNDQRCRELVELTRV